MDVTKTIRDISELTEKAQKACSLFMEKCKQQGLNVLITETYRSQERQNYLYEQGRTRPGNIVTWTKKSRHTSRRAWDICKNVKGQEYSDSNFFKQCGEVAKSLNITWGGTWSTPDTPHFEISEDWLIPEEVNEMTDAEKKEFEQLKEQCNQLIKDIDFLEKSINGVADRTTKIENPMIYNFIDSNMPEWAHEAVQWCVDKGYINGNGNGLGLDDKDLKWCTILYRAMN